MFIQVGTPLGLNTLCLCGGVDKTEQQNALAENPNSLVATTRRLFDFTQSGLSLNCVTTLVLDEADRLLDMGFWPQVLVFIGAKENADSLTKKLNKAGIVAEFKNGTTQVLIATVLLARGIHIEQLPVVINFELPMHAETYVHHLEGFPVTDQPSTGESKRAPRDKQANRRTQNEKSAKQFQAKSRTKVN